MQCKSCGGEVGEYKSGVAKKTGRSWKGWRCGNDTCGEMNFIRTPNPGAQQFTPSGLPLPGIDKLMLAELREIRKLLQRIIEIQGGGTQVADTELQADEEVPF